MAQFSVEPTALHEAANKFRGYSEEYTSIYNRLINAASTMGSAWDADDNQAFVIQIQGFCSELKAMATHLDNASKALDAQASSYETVRDTNTSGVAKLAN